MKTTIKSNLKVLRRSIGVVLVALTSIGLSSCGNSDPNSATLEVKPELGDLGNFMTIDTKEVKLSIS